MNISIQYNSTELYPAHIYTWNAKGVNCPTDDYSIGNVSNWTFSFTSDTYIDSSTTYSLTLGSITLKITDVVKNNGANITYTYTCIPALAADWDEILPDSFFENRPSNEQLNALYIALTGDSGGLQRSPNKTYVINSQWGYSGLTRRQVLKWIMALNASNIAGSRQLQPNGSSASTVSIHLTPRKVKAVEIADYLVPKIDKVWFGSDADDVGISAGSGTNQLSVAYNPLINASDTSFASGVLNAIKDLIYTPMKIETYSLAPVFENGTEATILTNITDIMDGTYTWFDYTVGGATYYSPIFSWEISPSGFTLESTGAPNRDQSNALISDEIQQNGKYNKFKRTLDSTVSEISNLNGDVSNLTQTVNGLTITVGNKADADGVALISLINDVAAGSTATIQADRIDINGVASFNNNVVIDQQGYITAVGATLTNASIVGGTVNIQSGTRENNAIVLTSSDGTYRSTFKPEGFKTQYATGSSYTTTINIDQYGTINSYRRSGLGIATPQFLASGDPDYYSRGQMRYNYIGVSGGTLGVSDQSNQAFMFINSGGTNPSYDAVVSVIDTYPKRVEITADHIVFYDSNDILRCELDFNNGLNFYKADGTAGNSYPASASVITVWSITDGGNWNIYSDSTGQTSSRIATVSCPTGSTYPYYGSNNGFANIKYNNTYSNVWIAEISGHTTTL